MLSVNTARAKVMNEITFCKSGCCEAACVELGLEPYEGLMNEPPLPSAPLPGVPRLPSLRPASTYVIIEIK